MAYPTQEFNLSLTNNGCAWVELEILVMINL